VHYIAFNTFTCFSAMFTWPTITGIASFRTVANVFTANCVFGLALSPDGRTIATGNDAGLVKTWSLASGQEQIVLAGHCGEVRSVAFTPNGRRLASAGEDRTIRLWDLESRKEVLMLRGHIAPVNGIAFSPDGLSLASAGHDGEVKFWRMP
jgi:WD40 repeat protein